jgi:hypothetical protein
MAEPSRVSESTINTSLPNRSIGGGDDPVQRRLSIAAAPVIDEVPVDSLFPAAGTL